MTDTAVLTGTKATMATGTVSYDVYTNPTCTSLALTGTAQTITTPGSLPPSASRDLYHARHLLLGGLLLGRHEQRRPRPVPAALVAKSRR